MARELYKGVEEPHHCPYLDDRMARLEQRVLLDLTPEETEDLLARGFRHFGPMWFRPVCEGCVACDSLRIDVRHFSPNRSQRRALNNVRRLRFILRSPAVDEERLALFHAWHKVREKTRGWDEEHLDRRTYQLQFAFPCSTSREIAYYDDAAGGRLVMLALCDETPRALSAIYCFYDPAYARFSLGIGNILNLIALAQRQARTHLYLGYRVCNCPSLRYKSLFRPHEILRQRPQDDEKPEWVGEKS